ncbi:wax ester/triacylglycerol synthase domain-containing protein [Longivirga aurantiaca]|uniref:diacylglycerol O-acyltransferase n=1 Tax=Longivirga aurantiaca TaxID=1837743 RepID=A0ABW1T2A0_9ACTN
MTVGRLSAFDAGLLALETDEAPLHIGALLILDGPAPDADLVRAELAHRAAALRECRQRVHRRPGDLRRPVWRDAPDVVPEAQLHAASLEPPGDRAALCRLVAQLMRVRLDTSGPLWQVWRIDGLEDGSWALLVTAHHTLIDGVSGAGLLTALLSSTDGNVRRVGSRVAPPAEPGLRERVRRIRQGVRTVAVPDLPPSLLNGALGRHRTWGWFTADLADLRRVAERSDCTINDVYLAALSGGLRTVLGNRAALGTETRVRVLVPVSTRRGPSDIRPGTMNAAFFVELPVHRRSAQEMLLDVADQTSRAKTDGVALATEQLLRVGDLVPAPLLDRAARAYARRGQARVNLVASDVRGPRTPLSLCGRQVREVVPCVPLALDVRATSALMSYAGRASLSVTVDSAVVPDAGLLVTAVAASLGELVQG